MRATRGAEGEVYLSLQRVGIRKSRKRGWLAVYQDLRLLGKALTEDEHLSERNAHHDRRWGQQRNGCPASSAPTATSAGTAASATCQHK